MVKKDTKKKLAAKKAKTSTKANIEKIEEIAASPIEVMNGDPSVVTPVEEEHKVVDLTEMSLKEAKEVLDNAEEMVVYKADKDVINAKMEEIKAKNDKIEEVSNADEVGHDTLSIVPETIVTEVQPEESEAAKPAKPSRPRNENKTNISHVKNTFGYFWNGIEIDY